MFSGEAFAAPLARPPSPPRFVGQLPLPDPTLITLAKATADPIGHYARTDAVRLVGEPPHTKGNDGDRSHGCGRPHFSQARNPTHSVSITLMRLPAAPASMRCTTFPAPSATMMVGTLVTRNWRNRVPDSSSVTGMLTSCSAI